MYLVGLLCISVVTIAVSSKNPDCADVTLRVSTMNLHGNKGEYVQIGSDFEYIKNTTVDVIALQETRNSHFKHYVYQIANVAKKYGYHLYQGTRNAILSKYEMSCTPSMYTNKFGKIKAIMCDIHVPCGSAGRNVQVVSYHGDYKRMWHEVLTKTARHLDCDSMEECEKNRKREIEEIHRHFRLECLAENLIVAGDFNQPSHLDWIEANKEIHFGKVEEFPVSKFLYENGLKDVYRTLYPDPVTHPGYTYPLRDAIQDKESKREWPAERIDYVYYGPTFEAVGVNVANGSAHSDHFYLHAALRFIQ